MNSIKAIAAAGLLGLGLLTGSSAPSFAQGRTAAGEIDGSWSGGGRVVLPSGNSERARCRATFRRQGGSTYGMSAVCATPSARVSQSASLRRVGPGQYSGRFYNSEYDVSGNVRISVQGRRLNASLAGGGGSAYFTLAR